MSTNNSGVMIALIPDRNDWSDLPLPHLTLVYAGDISDRKPAEFNEFAKDASMVAALARPIDLRVIRKEMFGRGSELVEAFRMQPTPELRSMRRAVERWNKSEYAFNPHVTIGRPGFTPASIPEYIRFNRILVAWGEDLLVFTIGGYH